MRVAFFGTPEFAVPSLRALAEGGHEVCLVVTQPDRPAGRGYRTTPSPVKEAAGRLGLPLAQPAGVAAEEFVAGLRRLAPDVCVLVAFGQKITPRLLAVPPAGWVNVHASLLPRWRGAAPVPRAIMAGDEVTGVTTMYLDTGWDTGDVILRREVAIGPEENAGEVLDRLAVEGAEALRETLALLARGEAPREPQDEALATLAPRLRPEEGELDWTLPALTIHNRVRALAPAPGAYTFFRGKRLKIRRTRWAAEEEPRGKSAGPPGTLVWRGAELWAVAGDGMVRLLEVQPEGGRAMEAEAFARGQRLLPGEGLGGKE